MIDIKEVRIGNVLFHKGEMVAIFGIYPIEDNRGLDPVLHSHRIAIKDPYLVHTSKWISQFEPITITPEILVKCGFVEKKEYLTHYFINESIKATGLHVSEFCIMVIGEEYHYSEYMYNAGIGDNEYTTLDYCQPLRYLHQLQNFVFFMTGQELEFTP